MRTPLLMRVLLAGFPVAASAAGPNLGTLLADSGVTASGHLAATYTHGFNDGQTLAYRAFDTDADSFEFNQAMLTLAREPADGFGGATTLLAGSDARAINAAYGNGSNADFALEQAYLRYAHSGLTLVGGRFVTLAGAEVIDASADANISRSLLFQLAEPLVHTGVRASYVLGNATFYLGVNNGIYTGNAVDTNRQKTLEAGVALAPGGGINLAVYDYYSREGGAGLNYLDFVGSLQATEKLRFVLNADWFSQHSGSLGPAHVYGLAAYADYTVNDRWQATLRGEWLETRGIAMNVPAGGRATLGEVTFTLGYSPAARFTLRGELRYDLGDRVYPDPGPGFANTQGNVALQALYAF